jgi:hypothetical protein
MTFTQVNVLIHGGCEDETTTHQLRLFTMEQNLGSTHPQASLRWSLELTINISAGIFHGFL